MEMNHNKFTKLVMIGIIIIIIGSFIMFLGPILQSGITSSNASASGGFIVLIGPIPIGFAFGEYSWLIMLILMVLALIVIIMIFILIKYSRVYLLWSGGLNDF